MATDLDEGATDTEVEFCRECARECRFEEVALDGGSESSGIKGVVDRNPGGPPTPSFLVSASLYRPCPKLGDGGTDAKPSLECSTDSEKVDADAANAVEKPTNAE